MSHPIEIAKQKLDSVGLPFALMASTLLGIYRDGDPIGGIFEFSVLASDMTEERIENLKKICDLKTRTSDIGIGIYDIAGLTNNNFELHPVYFKNGYAFNNLSGYECLAWPEELLKSYTELEWNHQKYRVPKETDRYLETYYGKDWKTPQPWNWQKASNYCTLQNIEEEKVVFKYETI